jgi:hypothetical protein
MINNRWSTVCEGRKVYIERNLFKFIFFLYKTNVFFYYYYYLKTSKTSKRHHFCKLNGNLPNIKNELKEKEVKTDLKKKKLNEVRGYKYNLMQGILCASHVPREKSLLAPT